MQAHVKVFIIMVLFGLTGFLIGCQSKNVKHSGFLTDYAKLQPGPKDGADWRYIKSGVDFRRYDKLMVDHIVFYFKEDSKYKGIHPEELQELADAFHQALTEALKGAYPIVEDPGPDVLRLRAAITDLKTSNPGLNTVTSIIPVGLAISHIKKGMTGTHANVGAATIEAELLDSQTNTRLAMAVDEKAGEKYKIISGMDKWGHAKGAFEFWAQRIRKWLDEVHGRAEG